jgi:hypothetical protein
MAQWAKLRQVILASPDIEVDGDHLRSTFSLGEGFSDPLLHEMQMSDLALAVGDEAYLEVIGALSDEVPLAGWLAKMGGARGYGLSVQHPDPIGVRDRAIERGIRVVADLEALGAKIVQLHPADVGLMLELDGITDPERWFWDDTDGARPTPGAAIDDVTGVTVAVADPAAMTELWAELLDLEPTSEATIALGSGIVRFVTATERPGLVGVELKAVDSSKFTAPLTMLGVEFTFGR